MMFPHALHGKTLSLILDHHLDEEAEHGMEVGFEFHHFLDILLGLNGILLALILMLISNRQMQVHSKSSLGTKSEKSNLGY